MNISLCILSFICLAIFIKKFQFCWVKLNYLKRNIAIQHCLFHSVINDKFLKKLEKREKEREKRESSEEEFGYFFLLSIFFFFNLILCNIHIIYIHVFDT